MKSSLYILPNIVISVPTIEELQTILRKNKIYSNTTFYDILVDYAQDSNYPGGPIKDYKKLRNFSQYIPKKALVIDILNIDSNTPITSLQNILSSSNVISNEEIIP